MRSFLKAFSFMTFVVGPVVWSTIVYAYQPTQTSARLTPFVQPVLITVTPIVKVTSVRTSKKVQAKQQLRKGTGQDLLDIISRVKECKGIDPLSPTAIGDKDTLYPAYGPYQIRQMFCDDANEFFGTSFVAQDMLCNRLLSNECLVRYADRWLTVKRLGHNPTWIDLAGSIKGGGPNGWCSQSVDTVKYRSDIRAACVKAGFDPDQLWDPTTVVGFKPEWLYKVK